MNAASAWLFLLGGILSGLVPAVWAYRVVKRHEGKPDAVARARGRLQPR